MLQRKPQGLVAAIYRRLFSSGTPKRGFENFMPKGMGGAAKAKPKPAAESGGGGGNKGDGDPKVEVNLPLHWLGIAVLAYMVYSGASGGGGGARAHEITFQEFKTKLLAQGTVSKLEVVNNNTVRVYVRADALASDVTPGGQYKYYFQIGSVDSFERKLDDAQSELGIPSSEMVTVKFADEVSLVSMALQLLPTVLLIGATYWMVSRQMRQMGGGGMGGFGGGKNGKKGGQGGFFGMVQAKTSTLEKGKDKIMFKDVAGCDEAKREIMEFVDFLKKGDKYKELGAKIPKGALLVGPPGTGKTLLAKAVAGEANVPFLSISGSDFMEMFVGVGPARVRDLFAQARSQSPSIIFIDEIDAIGRARGRGGAMGGHDERENTLNQLLVEMDGFATTTGVVVLAGTNRPDILDKALLRPGRFDRTITVDVPDINGRDQIFKVHLGNIKLTKEVGFYSERLAALTPGMSGADIANVVNEGALVAARTDKLSVDMIDFEQAIDRVIGGLEKKNKVITVEERRTIAFHESGHAVVSWFLEYAEPLLKVSIVPRGTSVLGFAQYLPNESVLLTKEQLMDRVCAILGGRAAEQVLLGKISTGAVNDLERVTQMAYAQVAVYGMNEKVGLLSYRMDREQFDKPYSEQTAQMIDTEVRAFVDDAYKRTIAIVTEKKALIEGMALDLLKKEVIGLDDIDRLLGKRPFSTREMRNIDRYRHGAGGTARDEEGGGGSGDEKSEGPVPVEGPGEFGGPKGPPGGGGGDGGVGVPVPKPEHRKVEPGVVVAT
ncbi:hypothetical protein FOA52_014673 [Chlamydomonas sp. UWO 241]|nr:hypothetical protein FOA52_014673 [Chlamydomonas sp. UWO 241]